MRLAGRVPFLPPMRLAGDLPSWKPNPGATRALTGCAWGTQPIRMVAPRRKVWGRKVRGLGRRKVLGGRRGLLLEVLGGYF